MLFHAPYFSHPVVVNQTPENRLHRAFPKSLHALALPALLPLQSSSALLVISGPRELPALAFGNTIVYAGPSCYRKALDFLKNLGFTRNKR
jgi:hypothetical protein